MGPLIDKVAVQNVKDFLGNTKGEILLDGRQFETNSESYFMGGRIIRYKDSNDMSEQEVFGPTIKIIECYTLEEAIEVQNKTL